MLCFCKICLHIISPSVPYCHVRWQHSLIVNLAFTSMCLREFNRPRLPEVLISLRARPCTLQVTPDDVGEESEQAKPQRGRTRTHHSCDACRLRKCASWLLHCVLSLYDCL